MTRIAVLRAARLPSFVTWDVPNYDELFEEDKLLIREFEMCGWQAESVVWNNPHVDWDQFDVALVRSTFDYIDELDHFSHALGQIEASRCRLFNSLAAIRWNINKNYLFDLQDRGAPIVPTYPVSGVQKIARQEEWIAAILKPVIGLGGSRLIRVPIDKLDKTIQELKLGDLDHAYLVQPFIDSVTTEGEWSLIYFNGRFSHAVLKKPAPGDFRVQGIYGGIVQRVYPLPEDLRDADAVMEILRPYNPLCARIDMVRIKDRLFVMEVELIEPILYFNQAPVGIPRLASAIQQLLAETS